MTAVAADRYPLSPSIRQEVDDGRGSPNQRDSMHRKRHRLGREAEVQNEGPSRTKHP